MPPIISRVALMLSALGATTATWAQNAPGSDPIVLGSEVQYMALPGPTPQASLPLDPDSAIPSWLQAKIDRYEAKAFAQLEGGNGAVYTERDVVTRQTGNALSRTCTTEVASNTYNSSAAGPAGRYGPNGQDQMVVLRGDVVSICK